MILKMTYNKPFRCFDAGFSVLFRPGVNLLVGDQGKGKSTLLFSVKDSNPANARWKKTDCSFVAGPGLRIQAVDFEQDNVRGASTFKDNIDLGFQVLALRSSHGEMVNGIINSLLNRKEPTPMTYLLDEPDMALSIRSCRRLASAFKAMEERGDQIIAAVHNPILILCFAEVYSVEHRRWMPSKDFVDAHLNGGA